LVIARRKLNLKKALLSLLLMLLIMFGGYTYDPLGLAAGENVYGFAPNVQGWIDPLGLCKEANSGWNMSKGGSTINGRRYSEHALERMAPDTMEIRAELHTRAIERAKAQKLVPGTKEYSDFINKQIDPRGIPPSVVEDAIKNTKAIPGKYDGTFIHGNENVKAIVNSKGDVITVIPK
jgi:hypothetical protein